MSSLHITCDSGTTAGFVMVLRLALGPGTPSTAYFQWQAAGVVYRTKALLMPSLSLTEAMLDYWVCVEQPRDSSWVTAVEMMTSAGDWHGAAVLERVPRSVPAGLTPCCDQLLTPSLMPIAPPPTGEVKNASSPP